MKIKDLIKQLGKIKDKEVYVGFAVWFGDENFEKGHKICWDGCWNRDIHVVERNGLKVAVVGVADNCRAHTFHSKDAETRRIVKA